MADSLDQPELIQRLISPSFLPQGSIFEVYIDEKIPDEQLVTATFCIVFSSHGDVLFTDGQADDHTHMLDIPGGHRENGESTEQSAFREVYEETGITPEKIAVLGYAKCNVSDASSQYPYPIPYSYMIFYVGITQDKESTNGNGAWLSLSEARENSWVKENRTLFESAYQESKILRGLYTKSSLDVYTSEGKFLGSTSYDRVHRQGLWHRGVHVWILNSKGEFLIQRRGPYVQTSPNLYEHTATGHIDSGQTSVQAALKEIEEEVGIHVSSDELIFIGTIIDQFTMYEGTLQNNEFDDVYLVRRDIEEQEIKHNEHEVLSFTYFDAREYLLRGRHGDPALVPREQEYELVFKYLFDDLSFK